MRSDDEWQDDVLVAGQRARRTDGAFTQDPDVAERDNKAMRMRANGKTWQQIADALGYGSRSAAQTQVQRAYANRAKPDVEALREAMSDQLEELVNRVAKVMDTEHLKVNAGQVVFDPLTGNLMKDDAPVLAAADRWLKVLERFARLHGLDAPQKIQAQVQNVRVTVDGAEDV
jgi:hypothetical protein